MKRLSALMKNLEPPSPVVNLSDSAPAVNEFWRNKFK
jgi:hypothetical protein